MNRIRDFKVFVKVVLMCQVPEILNVFRWSLQSLPCPILTTPHSYYLLQKSIFRAKLK